MQYANEAEAKEAICEYGKRMYARALVAGNEGNISCRTGDNEIWITPTMESKGYLTPDMLVKLDLEGRVLSSPYLPSTECRMHIGLYRANPEISSIMHAHPPVSTAFACCRESLPTLLQPEAIMLFGKDIPVTKFATPSTDEVPESVKPYAKTHRALLLGNHGALTWAATIKEAYFLLETLEQYCKIYMLAENAIGSPKPVPDFPSLLALYEKL